ncbi:hypothetical protein ZPR_0716 [Zunongwangia profunda SM-A87]|uniref:Uncharacterized protein n=1 Tax=Zunongwangia profunda (strain DSM 18752 / CCTCC AB 206139 / SM-A87) TaxID=655815 RepID=D5BGA7_ZUNPS|nr:hypothetical protein ZPR_0716 [Zunongwangia profunda SM-A87]
MIHFGIFFISVVKQINSAALDVEDGLSSVLPSAE